MQSIVLFPAKDGRALLQPGTHAFTGIGATPGAFNQGIEVGVGNLLMEREGPLDGGLDPL